MVIHFQNTFEDYREGSAVVAQRLLERSQNRGMRVTLWSGFVVLFFVAAWLWELSGADPLVTWVHILMPLAGIALITVILTVIAVARPTRRARLKWRAFIPLAWAVLFVASITLFFLTTRASGAPSPFRNISWDILRPHTTWFLLLFTVVALTFFNRVKSLRGYWDCYTAMARDQTAEITAQGIILTAAFRKSEYQWQGLDSFEETKNLFLISTGTGAHMMIPKRAFDSPEQLEAMRSLLKLIQSPGSAFPVLPVAPV